MSLMSTSCNLLDLAQKAIGEEEIAFLGRVIGLEKQETADAVAHALPAIIGAMRTLTSTPEGAVKLQNAINAHDGPPFDENSKTLENEPHNGTGAATSEDGVTSEADAILLMENPAALSANTNLTDDQATAIWYWLTPLLLYLIRRECDEKKLDAAGREQWLQAAIAPQADDVWMDTDSESSAEPGISTAPTNLSDRSLFSKLLPSMVVLVLAVAGYQILIQQDRAHRIQHAKEEPMPRPAPLPHPFDPSFDPGASLPSIVPDSSVPPLPQVDEFRSDASGDTVLP